MEGSVRFGILCLAAAVAAAGAVSCTLFQTDAGHGQQIAVEWCSECHRVAPDQPSGMRPGHLLPPPVEAPSFMDIAARPGMNAPWLDHFLSDLHLPMPTYRLRADEHRAVIAYILSLKPAGP